MAGNQGSGASSSIRAPRAHPLLLGSADMRYPGARLLRIAAATMAVLAVGPSRPAPAGAALTVLAKLDPLLRQAPLIGRTPVLVRATGSQALAAVLPATQLLGARILRRLPLIDAAAVDLPNV